MIQRLFGGTNSPFSFGWLFILAAVTVMPTARCIAASDENDDPEQTLQASLAALKEGDYSAYVDQLTVHEAQLQAGYLVMALVALEPMSQYGLGEDPHTYLMTRALIDLSRKHASHVGTQPLVSHQDWGLPASVRKLTTHWQNTNVAINAQVSAVNLCLEAANTMEDPRAFLVDALGIVMAPMTVKATGKKPQQENPYLDFVRDISERQWTIYQRGDYAVARLEPPKVDSSESSSGETPNQSQPAPTSTAHDPYRATPTSTPTADTSQLRIEMRKVDGKWMINGLVPAVQLIQSQQLLYQYPGQAASYSVPASSYPQSYSYPNPTGPAQPAPSQPVYQGAVDGKF